MDTSGEMGQLVDAFKGLAIEGATGKYLADVEAIVNSYFSQHSDTPTPTPQQQQHHHQPSPHYDTTATTATAVPTHHHHHDPTHDPAPTQHQPFADVLGESPIKTTRTPTKGDMSHASSGSLKAWGAAAEMEIPYNTTNRQDLQLIPDCEDDFYARSTEWRRRQTEQRNKQKTASKTKETEGCTWQPTINRYSYTNSGRLVYGKVEDRLYASEAAKQQKLDEVRKKVTDDATSGCTFRPTINTSKHHNTTTSTERDPFERLYNAGRKPSKKGPRRSTSSSATSTRTTPVLFTTYNPAHPPKQSMNMSTEELEAAENELAEIEVLLNGRMKGATRIALVESNYIDSDGEEDSMEPSETDTSASQQSVDFDTFLLRQNAFEERKRANIAFLEADTAPALHPTLTRKSMKGKKTNTAELAKPREDLSHQRLQKLLGESVELHSEVARLQGESGALMRKIAVLRRLPAVESRASSVFLQLQKAARELRGALDKPHVTVGGKAVKVGPEDGHLRDAFEERCNAAAGGTPAKPLRPRGADAEERKAMMQRWLRELIEVRNGLSDVRTRCMKVRDSLAQEKERCMRARDGVISWETAMELDFPRPKATGTAGEKPNRPPMQACAGDDVRARHETWQAWERGKLLEVIPGDAGKVAKAKVLLETSTIPKLFPGYLDCVELQPLEDLSHMAHTASSRAKEQYLVMCQKTKKHVTVRTGLHETFEGLVVSGAGKEWVVSMVDPDTATMVRKSVSIDAIHAPQDADGEHYGPSQIRNEKRAPDSLCPYLERVQEQNRTRELKRVDALRQREMKEDKDCTYAPNINSTPRYISRIAQSMQLLRGES